MEEVKEAKETEDEIKTEEELDIESKGELEEGSEEVEIVVDGEEEPASIPLYQMQKRLARSSKKVDAANTEKNEAEGRAAMLEEENKLLRLQAQQGKPQKRPVEADFDTDAEFEKALSDYDDARITGEVKKQTAQVMQASQTQAVQTQNSAELDRQIDEHYKRSADLKVPDYEATEAVAADILGDEISRQIVANSKASQLVMYHLGKNPGKAQSLKALIESNPMAGVMEIGRLEAVLKIKPKNSNAPDPEGKLPSGKAKGSGEDGLLAGATFE